MSWSDPKRPFEYPARIVQPIDGSIATPEVHGRLEVGGPEFGVHLEAGEIFGSGRLGERRAGTGPGGQDQKRDRRGAGGETRREEYGHSTQTGAAERAPSGDAR